MEFVASRGEKKKENEDEEDRDAISLGCVSAESRGETVSEILAEFQDTSVHFRIRNDARCVCVVKFQSEKA